MTGDLVDRARRHGQGDHHVPSLRSVNFPPVGLISTLLINLVVDVHALKQNLRSRVDAVLVLGECTRTAGHNPPYQGQKHQTHR
jgi:hypothetical protein